jgi:lycopene cyclase domain-containing protein
VSEVVVFGQWTYLIWLALFIGLPVAFLWWRWPQAIWRQRRALGWTVLGSLVGGWLWDFAAIEVGVWYYDPAYIAGVWLLGMPLEEWLWIVGVTLLFGSVTVVWMERGSA